MDERAEERLRAVELAVAKLQTRVGIIWGIVAFIGGVIGSAILAGIMTVFMRGGLA